MLDLEKIFRYLDSSLDTFRPAGVHCCELERSNQASSKVENLIGRRMKRLRVGLVGAGLVGQAEHAFYLWE
ncbi:MAG TPA: hypothetical protein VGM59_00290, partial [Dongiaceae bacterium]